MLTKHRNYRKKKQKNTALHESLQTTEPVTQNCQNSCSGKSQENSVENIRGGVYFQILANRNTLSPMISQDFLKSFQNSNFKEHLLTATSGIYLGKLLRQFSLLVIARKCYNNCSGKFEKIPRKKSVMVYFLKKLAHKTLGIILKYFGSAISKNIS